MNKNSGNYCNVMIYGKYWKIGFCYGFCEGKGWELIFYYMVGKKELMEWYD